MKVLVTGATGFVGTAICQRLNELHIPIVACSRGMNDALMSKSALDALNIQGALGGQNVVSLFDEVSCVVHLAARVHVMHETLFDPLVAFREVNVQGTLRLAAAAARAGVKRFVFLSTAKVNGESTSTRYPFTEADAANPQDPYSISKWEAEQGLWSIAQHTGMEVVVIRPPLVYGPGVKANFAALMHAVRRGIPLPFGAINNARSLVSLGNLVDFISLCISHPAATSQTFLVSDGQDISTSDLVRLLASAAHVSDRQIAVPVVCLKWLGKLTGKSAVVERLCGNLQLDISKAKTLLSWAPQVSVEEGIRRAIVGYHPTAEL